MVVRQKTFTLEEAAYLRSLPAVKEVSASRITYANWFKVECVRRYLKGEPARRIFREAGLEPSLIGSKRIERCVSRWKSDGSIMGEAAKEKTEDLDDEKSNIDAVGGGASKAKTLLENYNIANAAFMAIGASKNGRKMFDVRDLIIYQQVRQIAMLQEKIDELQHRLDAMNEN